MRFTVTWSKEAEAELARIYNKAPSALCPRITRACDELDRQLKYAGNQIETPLAGAPGGLVYGQPIESPSSSSEELLLAVVFEFSPDDMLLTVHQPSLIRKPQ
jgi:uncharacterized protein with LGFP repeats